MDRMGDQEGQTGDIVKTNRSGLGVLCDEPELVAHEQREEGVATGQDVEHGPGDRGGGVEEASEQGLHCIHGYAIGN